MVDGYPHGMVTIGLDGAGRVTRRRQVRAMITMTGEVGVKTIGIRAITGEVGVKTIGTRAMTGEVGAIRDITITGEVGTRTIGARAMTGGVGVEEVGAIREIGMQEVANGVEVVAYGDEMTGGLLLPRCRQPCLRLSIRLSL